MKNGDQRQIWRCDDCLRRFSTRNRAGKNTDPAAVLRALVLACRGYPYDDILVALRKEHGVERSKSALSRWISSFPLPWLEVRERFPSARGGPPVRGHLFTHAGLPYFYQYHTAKLEFAKQWEGLVSYLRRLPDFLDHSLFERAGHCSQLRLIANPGLRHAQDIGLTRLAGAALTLAPSHPKRHSTVETYFLNADRATVAVEVPVYYRAGRHGLIAGHIDILQVHRGRLWIADYKPGATAENPAKVATQLTLYANALSRRAAVPLRDIQCVYFDEKDAWFFDPSPLDGRGPGDGAPAPSEGVGKVEGGFSTFPADRRWKPR